MISYTLYLIPAAMQLRSLQTMTEIGAEQNSTIIFPMPIDLVRPFLAILDREAAGKPVCVYLFDFPLLSQRLDRSREARSKAATLLSQSSRVAVSSFAVSALT